MSEKQESQELQDQNIKNNEISEEIKNQEVITDDKQDQKEIINEQKLEELLMEGRILFNGNQLDEAQAKFYDALEKGIKFYKNEIAEQLAKFYYSYGNTLLAKIEQQNEFLGERVKKITKNQEANGQKKQIVGGVVIQEEQENSKQQEQEKENQENQENGDDEDDIEIAWENLEVARTLTEKQFQTSQYKNDKEKIEILKNLSKIKLRQGDLQAINDCFDEAIKEYNECLKLRMQFENPETSRELAEMFFKFQQNLIFFRYFLLGNVNLYKNEKRSEEIALEFFQKATNCLQALLESELNAKGQLFSEKDKSLKNQNFNREPLKESFLDNATTKELKSILNMMYDKIEDTIAQLQEKDEFEKEKQMALFSQSGFSTTNIEEKKVINLGVIKGTGGQKKIVIPNPNEDGFPEKKLKLE